AFWIQSRSASALLSPLRLFCVSRDVAAGCAYVHLEAWKGTIIRGWHPQGGAPRRLGRRKTFASWLTPSRDWYGRLDRMAPLNSSTSAGSNIPASLRNKRSI